MSGFNPSNLQANSEIENSRGDYKVRKIKRSMENSVEEDGRLNLRAGAM